MAERIFEKGSLVIRAESAASDEMVSLIGRTVWGSGNTRYRINDAREKLALLNGSQFITSRIGRCLVGVYVLRPKRVAIGENTYPAFYRTYLAVDPEHSGRGYGALLVEKAREHYREKLGGAGLLYGYIEADNSSSLRVSQLAGYESIATFETAVFSRLRPREHVGLRRLEVREKTAAVTDLEALYAGHNFRDFGQSLDVERYFILEDDKGIAAGVQVETCDWVIKRLAGVSGFLLVHLVWRTPVLRRLFDARRCRFLKLGNLYARLGAEASLFALMESVLSHHRVGSAMILHDPRSPVFRRLERSGAFGFLNSGVNATVHVMAEKSRLILADEQHLKDHPIVISPLDIG